MKSIYLTIEQAVERCYPKATKEEKAKLAEQYRKVLKDDQKIMYWEPESEEERRQMETPSFGLMQFPHDTGHWQTVKEECMNDATATAYRD